MKTAMQELIDELDKQIKSLSSEFIGTVNQLIIVRNNAISKLEKEKEQIIDFAYEILKTSDEHQSGYVSIEEIYNQTYNQNK